MHRTFVFRMYPTQEQDQYLRRTLETCRILYNNALAERKEAWENEQRSVTFFEQSAQLPILKKTNLFLVAAPSKVLVSTLRRLDQSYKNFFRRVKNGEKTGYPRFKPRERYTSFVYPQWNTGASLVDGKLRLSKVGDVRIRGGRPIAGTPKNCTITLKADGWYARILCEVDDPEPLPATDERVGIDVGIAKFATLSNEEEIANPHHWKRAEKNLRFNHRRLARRKKGSKRRVKARHLLAKSYLRLQRQRQDFHHKVSHDLVQRFDSIAIENLNIAGMMKNHPLAKHIADVGWYQFRQFLTYKAAEAGRQLVVVNARGTSQACSNCGEVVPKQLSDRWHSCLYCGYEADRDTNAAVNILQRGVLVSA